MATTLAAKDATGATQQLVVQVDGSGNLTPVHLEDATQRSALLAALAAQTAATQPVSVSALPLPAGAATASGVAAIVTALGSPLQTGGAVTISNTPAVTVAGVATDASLIAIKAALAKPGVGDLTAVPAGSTNGTLLGTKPAATKKVRLYLPSGASISFTVCATAPTSAPSAVYTASAANTGPNWDEELVDGQNVYVTAVSGAVLFRYI